MIEPAPAPERIREIAPEQAAGRLTIDLGNLQRNWLELAARAAPAECAGVVKADAYGLGLDPCARALWAAGCRTFFVAVPQEGARLRGALPEATIFVLDGLLPGLGAFYAAHRLVPVLAGPDEIAEWADLARQRGHALSTALHVETGINRLGLTPPQVHALADSPDLLAGLEIALVMSHFACADEPDAEMNPCQRQQFDALRALLPPAPASLFNSPATLDAAGPPYDLVRTGVALFGGNPFADRPDQTSPVAYVSAILLQVRDVAAGETVGYGATWRALRDSRLGVIGVGYGDGFPRALGAPLSKGPAQVYIAGHFAPIVGRVSMDLITIDLTDVPPEAVRRGARVELMGEHVTVNDVAQWAGTIPYEILTGLGSRFARHYVSADHAKADPPT